jgi:hypothetical protein
MRPLIFLKHISHPLPIFLCSELEDEKEGMMARDTRMDDIIDLNVGGTRFTTKR